MQENSEVIPPTLLAFCERAYATLQSAQASQKIREDLPEAITIILDIKGDLSNYSLEDFKILRALASRTANPQETMEKVRQLLVLGETVKEHRTLYHLVQEYGRMAAYEFVDVSDLSEAELEAIQHADPGDIINVKIRSTKVGE